VEEERGRTDYSSCVEVEEDAIVAGWQDAWLVFRSVG
jgi:hypothetical protein